MKTLIIVDMQNDFCKGGALAVPDGDAVVPLINSLQPHFDLVVATQDWHPVGHQSFASYWGKQPGEFIEINGIRQELWPDHCEQFSYGANFVSNLDRTRIAHVFQKGTYPEVDSYSGFFDNSRAHTTGMSYYLKELNAHDLFICGLATDYCVKFTALDGVGLGFNITVVEDACRAVNLQPGDGERALTTMREAGARIVRSSELLQ